MKRPTFGIPGTLSPPEIRGGRTINLPRVGSLALMWLLVASSAWAADNEGLIISAAQSAGVPTVVPGCEVETDGRATPSSQSPPTVTIRNRLADVNRGDTVWILTLDGRRCKGRYVSSSPNTIEVTLAERPATFALLDLRLVTSKRPLSTDLGKGTLMGAAILGGTFGALCYALGEGHAGDGFGTAVFCGAIFAGFGAGLGAGSTLLANALKRPTRVFERVEGTNRARIAIEPVVALSGAGVRIDLAW